MMLYRMCSDFNCLPSSGGLLDQDSYMMYGLQAIAMAVAEREQKEASKNTGPKFTSGPAVRRR